MHFNNKSQLNDFTVFITTFRLWDGRYRGRIWVSQRDANGVTRDPTVFIETPGALKSIQATRIEAAAYVKDLIQSGALHSALDALIEDTAKNHSY